MPLTISPLSQPNGSVSSMLTDLYIQKSTPAKTPAKGQLAVREKFQDFVGGTFYKEMLKALRAAQKPSKYLNGGQAEKIFQGQMDQEIAEDLARKYAGHLADPLFESYLRQSSSASSPSSAAPETTHALDVAA
jgi:Rod binding domain-containing protein